MLSAKCYFFAWRAVSGVLVSAGYSLAQDIAAMSNYLECMLSVAILQESTG